MKTGKSYWALTVNDRKVREQLVSDPTVKNVLSNVKAIRIAMKFQLDNKTEYATEAEAEIAFNKLDEVTRRYVMICETIPVSLGLGWC
jgi:hypothetical protein